MRPQLVFLGTLLSFATLVGCGGERRHNNSGSGGSTGTAASLSTTSFDFGDNLVNNTLTQTAVVVTNTGPNIVDHGSRH